MHGRCLAILILSLAALEARAANLTILPNISTGAGPQHFVRLLSDGRSLIGVEGQDVFRWSPDAGRVVLGQIPSNAIATNVSGDGGTIIGRLVESAGTQAFRWRPQGGVTLLPNPQGYDFSSAPTHVSFDGSIIYGTGSSVFEEPIFDKIFLGLVSPPYDFPDIITVSAPGRFRWDESSGTQLLTDWTAPHFASNYRLSGISDDGAVATGIRDNLPALWTIDDGLVQPGPPTSSYLVDVRDISGDGSTVIGMLRTRLPFVGDVPHMIPFRWRPGGDYELLTEPLDYGEVYAVSTDGSTILGTASPNSGFGYSFVWREGLGAKPIHELIAEHGLTLPPGQSHYALEMSDDGLVFKGRSDHVVQPAGSATGTIILSTEWIADLSSPMPEPTAMLQTLLGLTFAAMASFQGRRRLSSAAGCQLY